MVTKIKSLIHLQVKLFLVLVLIFSIFTPLLNDQKAKAFSGTGGGTTNNPYLISTCTQLQSIGATEDTEDRLYKLTADIDCSATSSWNSGAGFQPLPEFSGTLDGQGHTINNLTINRPDGSEVGLFSQLRDEALVTRLTINNATITGSNFVGALASQSNYAIIRDVHVNATVTTSADFAGGIIGSAFGWQDDSLIQRSSFTGSVSSANTAGGILAQAYNGFTIEDVYVNATISSATTGGVVGHGLQSCGYRYIKRALVKGTLTGSTEVGGIAGKYDNLTCYTNEIDDSVSLATLAGTGDKGGAIGNLSSSAVTFSNYFFNQTAANTTNCLGTGSGSSGTCNDIGSNVAPSDEPYAHWDFSTIWQENSGTVTQRASSALTGPNTITGLTANEGDPSNSVDVSWTAPVTLGSYPLGHYRAEIKKASDSWSNILDYYTDTTTSANFQDLQLGTDYNIRVAAVTEYSTSEWVETTYSTPDPEIITANTCEELDNLDQHGSYLDTYKLGSDIDCTGYHGFTPLHWDNDFGGVFDGQGHTISHLNISGVDAYGFGLFKYTDNAVIKDTNFKDGSVIVTEDSSDCGAAVGAAYDTYLSNIDVSGYEINCAQDVGGITGYYEIDNSSLDVENLSSDGVFSAGYHAGGLFGGVEVYEEKSLGIDKSFSSASVTTTNDDAGGLIGYVYVENEDDTATPATFTLQNSYADGQVHGQNNVGGLIGNSEVYNDGYDSIARIEVVNSYSSANSVASQDSAGGVIGYMDDLEYEGEQVALSNVFVTGAVTASNLGYALIGSSDGIDAGELTINNSYFDQTATGQDEATNYVDVDGWTAINTDGSDANYFKNNHVNPPLDEWDFTDTWQTRETNYPILKSNPPTSSDRDGDGINDSVETEGPNNGDANGDGIADNTQTNVTSYVDELTNKYAVVQTSCTSNYNVQNGGESTEDKDSGYDYPVGLVAFVGQDCGANGSTATITLYYYGNYDPTKFVLRKSDGGSYSTIKNATLSSVIIGGRPALKAVYQIVDGGPLDQDGSADGNIVDPVGVAALVVGAPNTGLGGDLK